MPVGYLIDIQGTLIEDDTRRPVRGAPEALASLRERGVPFVLVTNNTKLPSEDFRRYLKAQGFVFSDDQYLDPLMVLTKRLPPCPAAAYGSPQFLSLLKRLGYTLDTDAPEAVLIGIKPDFTNDEYAEMIEAVMGGAKPVGMHETSVYAKNGRRYPGVGAILKMVAFATGRPYEVVGKPSRAFYETALSMLSAQGANVAANEAEMISDDLFGDLVGAKRMGMATTLVLSGKIRSVEEVAHRLEEGADRVASDIGARLDVPKKERL